MLKNLKKKHTFKYLLLHSNNSDKWVKTMKDLPIALQGYSNLDRKREKMPSHTDMYIKFQKVLYTLDHIGEEEYLGNINTAISKRQNLLIKKD